MASADGSADSDRVTRAGKRSCLGPEPRSQRAGGGPDEPRTTVSEGNEKGEMESSRQVRKRENEKRIDKEK